MEKQKVKNSGASYTVIFWLVMLLLVLVMTYFNRNSESLNTFEGNLACWEEGWLFGEKGKSLKSVKLSDLQYFEPGKVYVLTTDLTYSGEGDNYPSAFIINGNLELEVYLHGKSVLRHSNAEKIFKSVQSVGGAVFSVPLDKNCEGHNFRMELRSSMRHPDIQRLPSITFGDHETQIRFLFLKSAPSLLISCAIMFSVIILVMLGNTVDGTQWTYMYFSLFAVQIVLYRAVQDLFLMYIWAKPFMANVLEHFTIVSCPIPLLMSFRYRLKPPYRRPVDFLLGGSIFLLIMEMVLHFTGIKDVRDMVLITHLWALTTAIGVVSTDRLVKKKTGQGTILRKLLPILIGALMDVGCFYLHKYLLGPAVYYTVGDFIGLGLLITLILLIWQARQERICAYREIERNNVLSKVAYTDALTGIGNRAAFTKALTRVATGKAGSREILVVSADLNGLKQTNDQMGHTAGDILIQRAAEMLRDSLSEFGQVFRTGGDEFFAILENVSEEQWNNIYADLQRNMEEQNQYNEIPLSIAVGAAVLENGNINKAIQISDQRMYAHKEEQHQKMKKS